MAGALLSWKLILLNLTTLFGFLLPSAYVNTGAWSIGNEMVYYAFTPLLIWVYNRRLAFGNLLTCVACLVGLWFSSHFLTVHKSLADQWVRYINPFNNLFLYCSGLAIYYNAHRVRFSTRTTLACAAVAVATFILYPVTGNQIHIVTGMERVVFSMASVLMVMAFYKNTIYIPQLLSVPLTHLGVIAYGVYLLHPIAYRCLVFVLKTLQLQMPPYAIIGLTMAVTVSLALPSFKLLEKPFIRLGKKLTTRSGVRQDQAVSLSL